MGMGNSQHERVDVSFVIPCYNVEPFLARCLDSVLAQNGASYEIVCVDDGSTDRTSDILASYSNEHPKIRVLAKDNTGLADSRNRGVLFSRGEFISFIDGDDLISPNYLKYMWKAHADTNADLIVSGLSVVSERGMSKLSQMWESDRFGEYELVRRKDIGTLLLEDDLPCAACGKLIRKNLCARHPFSAGRFHEDVEIISDFYLDSSCCVKMIEPLYGYYMRSGSITHAVSPSRNQICDFVDAYRAVEESVLQTVGCTAESIACHKMITACRFHSMLIRSEFEAEFSSAYVDLLANADAAMSESNKRNIARKIRWRYLLLRRAPLLYDCAFFLFERVVKGLQ